MEDHKQETIKEKKRYRDINIPLSYWHASIGGNGTRIKDSKLDEETKILKMQKYVHEYFFI